MPKYYYGELGYQPEGEFEVLADAGINLMMWYQL